jgi:hypothetical protein
MRDMDLTVLLGDIRVKLPFFQTSIPELSLLETKWASILNPVITNPISNPTILNGVSIVSGSNVINHKLGQTPQGWFVSDINAPATIYRSAAFNNLTLTLTSSADCIVNLVIY